jgi:putative intracellular protease/amidase
MKVLMVITSHDQLGDTGRKTGFWLEELAAPYYVFKDAGVEITLASPKGGRPPLDPKSNEPNFRTDLTLRFEKDTGLRKLSLTRPFASTASSRKTSTPSSTRAATARCGISPKTSTPSS